MVSGRSGLLSQWSHCGLSSLVSHHSGLLSQWSLITVVSSHSGLSSRWSLIKVVSNHSGLSSRWSLITVVSHPSGLSSQWSLVTVVSHPGGLSSQWSLVTTSGAQLYISVLTHLHSTKLICSSQVIINGQTVDNLMGAARKMSNITEYNGPPCNVNPCMNGGVCIPILNSAECRCPYNYMGQHCEKRKLVGLLPLFS